MEYKFLDHTADVKFQANGENLEEAFLMVSSALFETMYSKDVKPIIKKKIKLKEKDKYTLLYSFVEEFIFLLDTEGFLPSKVENLKIKNNELICDVYGDHAKNYSVSTEVKAMTYSDMSIEEVKEGYKIVGVFDV